MIDVAEQEKSILEHAEVVIENTDEATDEEFQRARSLGLGATDAAPSLNMSKPTYGTPTSVFHEKRGHLPPKEVSEKMELGLDLEPAIGALFQKRTGVEVHRYKRMLRSIEWPWMQTNLDFLAPSAEGLVECKNVGARMVDDWIGEETEPLIPDHYMLQGQHELAVTGQKRCWYAVLIGGQTFRWILVERDQSLIEEMAEKERQFWELVQNDTPPAVDGSDATTRALKARFGNPHAGSMVELDGQVLKMIEERQSLRAARKRVDEDIAFIDNNLRQMLGDFEAGTVNGVPVVTYKRIEGGHVEFTRKPGRRFYFPKPKNRR